MELTFFCLLKDKEAPWRKVALNQWREFIKDHPPIRLIWKTDQKGTEVLETLSLLKKQTPAGGTAVVLEDREREKTFFFTAAPDKKQASEEAKETHPGKRAKACFHLHEVTSLLQRFESEQS